MAKGGLATGFGQGRPLIVRCGRRSTRLSYGPLATTAINPCLSKLLPAGFEPAPSAYRSRAIKRSNLVSVAPHTFRRRNYNVGLPIHSDYKNVNPSFAIESLFVQ